MAKINEALTRRNIIDKRLSKGGWDVGNVTQVTTELDIWVGSEGMTKEQPLNEYQGHQFADYALLGDNGYPLAVVEAKKTSKDARIGQEQARQYAENIQKNSGKDMPFVFYTNGHDIYFWETEKYPPRKVYGFPSKKDLERMLFLRNNEKPLSQELINRDISGRPYQIEAIRSVFENLDKGKRKSLLVMATGTGKTRTCVSMIDVLMRTNRVQKVLFLVDRIALRNQALDAFKEFLPNAPVWPKIGEHDIVTDRRIYCATYQTMLNIIENNDCPLSPHFFDMVVADESHRSIYNVYRNIFDYFDTIQLGLTATPKDVVEHNTFGLFDCADGIPTYAYSFDEAVNNKPPYLSNFEVLKVRTKFQKEGIRKDTISIGEQQKLLADGKEPAEINYEGSEIEKKVTNRGTNALIVQEFMEECIKDESGTLPGKTIFFAMTMKHARRLQEVFDDLYPEHKGNIAKVIVSDDARVYGKGGLLDQFINKDFPRIAISVDMLDTGIDVRELVNLVFAKPVFSYTKFWQMIGRGTRLLEVNKIKPWCKTKDKFLIIDCWENFDYFQMNPTGKIDKATKPLPVRIFEAKLLKLNIVDSHNNAELVNSVTQKLKVDIAKLPSNNVVILDAKSKLEKVDETFWQRLNEDKKIFLEKEIAPLMRTRTGEDFKAMSFELKVLHYSIAKLDNQDKRAQVLGEALVEMVSDLPLSVNVVAKEKKLIEEILHGNFLKKADDNALEVLIQKIAPLMKYRDEGIKPDQDSLDLRDITSQKEYIKFGPEHERLTIQKYREKVESLIKKLETENEVLQKLKQGEAVSQEEVEELADTLAEYEPYPTEENLQKAYDARQVKFLDLIKYIMGLGGLVTFSEKVSEAFAEFIAEHNTLAPKQIQFLIVLRDFIINNGELAKKDLVSEPFTKIHARGFLGVFPINMQKEIIQFTDKILNYAK
ncbi:restriction endonuclease subunit R [Candidatus Falkowbacteria bacterium RIFOXYB2_FULL_47_14]|uniref:Restriction endonuclease subunit R n=1 Tax=Candidatus Falkowbacteria bacterium RIFOXYA2_FULL_47_19 TaxID=1797994 RepID=A0A1F5SE95_9BACT|nr:MAG: restriction endonuclease subunit R [Candidatus Falkowbacteria bacterium RIFOXYA2_FULL_47_19]OGF35306.1 MAG: restriction endonuclease subunit R [Candidatus Falkowbacteria bacterium RIFOXYC2_FULL_46_15]OGF43743.1 MAG: restriction endonuclease subunit R [Candidatus Falkowbacteria bacterium RIFOXYB2_FULL_47_14]